MAPKKRFALARTARPMLLLFIPLTALMWAAGVSFIAIGAWLLTVGAFSRMTACPQCRQSIYWVEEYPYRTLLAHPHEHCTRCGFNFIGE